MSDKTAQQRVLEVYPDAEVHSDDYYHHWIARGALSVSILEDEDALTSAFEIEDPEEQREALIAVERAAQDAAWEDAASKLPKNVQEEQEKRPKWMKAVEEACPTCRGSREQPNGPRTYGPCLTCMGTGRDPKLSAASPASPAPSVEIPRRPEANSVRVVLIREEGASLATERRPTFDNNIASEHFDKLEGIIRELQAQLAAMTEDRDLWRGEHNDDCPNAGLAESRVREAEVAAYRRAAEAVLDEMVQIAPDPDSWDRGFNRGIGAAKDAILSLIPTDNQKGGE